MLSWQTVTLPYPGSHTTFLYYVVNFNDMMGGGDKVIRNLIFNSCRESGDHGENQFFRLNYLATTNTKLIIINGSLSPTGPINSWDRQPYLTKHRDGKTPSFNPIPREIIGNFIIANYGADQGVDNDDGEKG